MRAAIGNIFAVISEAAQMFLSLARTGRKAAEALEAEMDLEYAKKLAAMSK